MMLSDIPFTKMHGIGNDFVVINALQQKIHFTPDKIQQLSHRHTGIGFDQLLVIEPSTQADFFCRIYNSDGSEAEQCGNGLRCVARFLHETGVVHSKNFILETKAGRFPVEITDYNHIQINMGVPMVDTNVISLAFDDGTTISNLAVLSLGNPHAIVSVSEINGLDRQSLGKAISTHPYFPCGTNVGFMQIITPSHIRLRTYERGAGETYACGSNACAATIVGIKSGELSTNVQVEFSLGSVWVAWLGHGQEVYLTGPAANVFDGHFKI